MIATVFGGIGLFLLGMVLMTDGLKAAAGDALRDILSRFTGGPLSAVFSGAAVTLIVQSSSATTLATIGFVSAGLLTFPQAIGLMLGAAVGTTSTGWIVSLLGLKLQMGTIAMPLIGVGALLRLLTRGRTASLGLALAGFGLIFVGISTLQNGMQDVAARIDPSWIPGASFLGRLAMVGIGIGITVVMQSSSAGVATTLTALHAGTVDLEQAALLVIGHNIGTTATAALAGIGASTPARRTAISHVIFSIISGTIAFVGLPFFLAASSFLLPALGVGGDAASIAFFHTAFNVIGIAALLPFIGPYTAFITRLVPDRGPVLTRNLDASLTQVAPVATEAARRTAIEISLVLVDEALRRLRGDPPRRDPGTGLDAADAALAETRRFVATIVSPPESAKDRERHLSVLHAMDHLDRLTAALRDRVSAAALIAAPEMRERVGEARKTLETVRGWLADPASPAPTAVVRAASQETAEWRREQRKVFLEKAAVGGIGADDALTLVDAARWLDRVVYHVWRATHHLEDRTETVETTAESEVFEDADDEAYAQRVEA